MPKKKLNYKRESLIIQAPKELKLVIGDNVIKYVRVDYGQ